MFVKTFLKGEKMLDRIIDYDIVVNSSTFGLVLDVKQKIKEGWEPYNRTFRYSEKQYDGSEYIYFVQVIVKRELQ